MASPTAAAAPAPAPPPPPALAAPPPPPFGILFTGSKVGYPILSTALTQTGPTQWVLDLRSLAGSAGTTAAATVEELQQALAVTDVTLFLSAPGALPAGAGLALYVAVIRSPGEAPSWEYRGCVAEGKPSDAFPLGFPLGGSGSGSSSSTSTPPSLLPLSLLPTATAAATAATSPAAASALVGVSLEPALELSSRESSSVASRLEFGRRVGLDLFRFAQSFAPAADPAAAAAGAAVLPPGALDAWWRKFELKFRKDPEFLLRRQE